MNERIKELADEAWQYANNNSRDGDDTHGWLYRDKFAELLIKECHKTIKKDMELAQIQLLPLDFGMYANGRLRRIIKEHFGVE